MQTDLYGSCGESEEDEEASLSSDEKYGYNLVLIGKTVVFLLVKATALNIVHCGEKQGRFGRLLWNKK